MVVYEEPSMTSRFSIILFFVFALFALSSLSACDSTVSRQSFSADPDGDDVTPDPDGDVPDGDLPDGDDVTPDPDGDVPDGDLPDGDEPDGDLPDGDLPDGDEPDGDSGLNYNDLALGEATDLPQIVTDGTTAVSTLYVGADLPIWDTFLDLTLEHPFWQEVEITLQDPTGQRMVFSGLSGETRAGTVRTLHTTAFAGLRTKGVWTVAIRDFRPADDGILHGWSLRFGPPTEPMNPLDDPLPRVIPDNDPQGVAHRQAFGSVNGLDGLCLRVSIRNGFAGDYRIELKTPTGLRRILLDQGWEQGAFATRDFYTDNLDGDHPAGYWTLIVSDRLPGDEGTLTAWGLTFNCPDPNAQPDGDEPDGDEPDGDEPDGDEPDGDEEEGEQEQEEEEDDDAPLPAGSCAMPNEIADLPFNRDGMTTGGQALLLPPAACAGWTMTGPESVYAVTLTQGQDVTASLTNVSAGFNPGIYVLGTCDSAADFCTGRDRGAAGEDEWVFFTAPADGTYYIVVDSGDPTDAGSFTLELTEGAPLIPGERLYFPAESFPIEVPDRTTISSIINVPMAFLVDSVCVQVDITHPSIGQLIVKLQSPDGTVRSLHNLSGGAADDIHRSYVVHNFDEENARGDWLLTVRDNAPANVGTLDNWYLTFGCDPLLAPGDDDDDDDDDDLNPVDSVACSQDQFGNNHTVETAWPISLPANYSNLKVCSGGNDLYKFNLSAGQVVTMTVTFIDDNGDIDLEFFGPNPTNSSAYIAYTSGVTNTETLTYSVITAGIYVLKVEMYSSNVTTGQPYTMSITTN